MKRFSIVFLCAATLLSTLAFAADMSYTNPFERGTFGCEQMRIPSLYTLGDGSVAAACDLRWNHGTDSPQNIDTAFAVSPDGYGRFETAIVNRFDDYCDGSSSKNSASFIDCAVVQSRENGRLFLLVDAFPSGYGYPNAVKSSGCRDGRLVVTDGSREYAIGDFKDGFAPVAGTGYAVDSEYRLYKNGEPLWQNQLDSNENPTGERVRQSVFYSSSDLTLMGTSYLWLRSSDDGGKTWSEPTILNPFVKRDDEAFLGVCPGRGAVVKVDGRERIIFVLYSNSHSKEKAVTCYSDDGGMTWIRGEEVDAALFLGKTSESQIVEMPDRLRMYCRNNSKFTGFCDSFDGGVSWTKAQPCEQLRGTKNCMVSFVNTNLTVDGRQVIACSMGSDTRKRADGMVRLGVVKDSDVQWLKPYYLGKSFFAYSCLTQLRDGSIACLYEDEPAHISYIILRADSDGNLSEINGNDITYEKDRTFVDRFVDWFNRLFFKIRKIILNTA